MITLITGNPRAGKTYLGVHWLVNNHYTFNKTKLEWEPKIQEKTGEPSLIITDIENFKLPHKKFDEVLIKTGQTVETFFTCEFQEKLSQTYSTIIYFLDEVHRYFPDDFGRRPSAKAVRDYFAYHGHYNQHFWLMTQSTILLWRDIPPLAEVEYRAVPMSLRPPFYFWYRPLVPGTKIEQGSSLKIRHNKKIFAMYKTANRKETHKGKTNKLYYYMAAALVVIIMGLIFIGFKAHSDYKKITIESEKAGQQGNQSTENEQTPPPAEPAKPTQQFEEIKDFKWFPADSYQMNGKTYILDPETKEFVYHKFVTPGRLKYMKIPGEPVKYYVYRKDVPLEEIDNRKDI